jgi:hypothetical protein
MKIPVISLAFTIFATSVFAAPTVNSPKALATVQEHDAKSFCYNDDKAYSEGAKFNGMRSLHRPSTDFYERNKTALYWEEDINIKPEKK